MTSGDPFDSIQRRLEAVPRRFAWNPHDAAWPERARAALATAVGVLDEPFPHGEIEFGGRSAEKGYDRVRVEFPSHEGWSGRGWLLTPDAVNTPAPAVVCLPGHGKGADAIVGLIDEPYQANFALQCVRQGWHVLAVEQVSFGVNRSSCVTDRESSCARDSMMALLLGETVTGWRVRDAMAARRALAARSEVDPNRIAVMGISGGGLTALWAAALDPGFCAAGVSGYFCTMADSIAKIDHCADNYVPGFGRLMDIPDLAALVAPRWLAVESGTRDQWFGSDGFLEACRFAEKVYAHHRVPNRFESELFEGEHIFKGDVLFSHLQCAFGEA